VQEHLDGQDLDADTERLGELTGYSDVIADDPDDLALVDELFQADDDVVLAPRAPATRLRKGVGRALMITGGVLGLLVLLYAFDLITSVGEVPRGVTVAGVDVGGLSRQDAETKLRQQLEPRLTKPFVVRAGDVTTQLNPTTSGLGLDWPTTLDQAGRQPFNPIDRVVSFFKSHEVGVVTKTMPTVLGQAVQTLAQTQLNHAPTEGDIGFRDLPGGGLVVPFAIEPRQGQTLLDTDAAVSAITAGWLNPAGVTLQAAITPVKATPAGVDSALNDIVVPAVSGPVTLHGQGQDAVLAPADIAQSFQFAAQDDGQLQVRIDQRKLQDAVQQSLAATEQAGKNAQIVFTGDQPSVVPSVDTRKVNWPNTFLPLVDVLKKTTGRDLTVAYDTTRPAVTTEAAGALGIKEVVGEFTASGLTGGAVTNVGTLAAKVSGTIVKPGDTFSLDALAGAFSEAQGYMPAPVYEDGSGPSLIGGGVSALSSALYNAEYLAGLKDVDHAEHDYYLDQYPVARDAKAMETTGTPVDLKFINDAPTGIAIEADASGGSVTVKIWGTRLYNVTSISGDETNVTSPPVQFGTGGACVPTAGEAGFSTTDTRVLDNLSGTEVRRETRAVTYAPQPEVICD
jgi:vancomycin resistance protein YoaR